MKDFTQIYSVKIQDLPLIAQAILLKDPVTIFELQHKTLELELGSLRFNIFECIILSGSKELLNALLRETIKNHDYNKNAFLAAALSRNSGMFSILLTYPGYQDTWKKILDDKENRSEFILELIKLLISREDDTFLNLLTHVPDSILTAALVHTEQTSTELLNLAKSFYENNPNIFNKLLKMYERRIRFGVIDKRHIPQRFAEQCNFELLNLPRIQVSMELPIEVISHQNSVSETHQEEIDSYLKQDPKRSLKKALTARVTDDPDFLNAMLLHKPLHKAHPDLAEHVIRRYLDKSKTTGKENLKALHPSNVFYTIAQYHSKAFFHGPSNFYIPKLLTNFRKLPLELKKLLLRHYLYSNANLNWYHKDFFIAFQDLVISECIALGKLYTLETINYQFKGDVAEFQIESSSYLHSLKQNDIELLKKLKRLIPLTPNNILSIFNDRVIDTLTRASFYNLLEITPTYILTPLIKKITALSTKNIELQQLQKELVASFAQHIIAPVKSSVVEEGMELFLPDEDITSILGSSPVLEPQFIFGNYLYQVAPSVTTNSEIIDLTEDNKPEIENVATEQTEDEFFWNYMDSITAFKNDSEPPLSDSEDDIIELDDDTPPESVSHPETSPQPYVIKGHIHTKYTTGEPRPSLPAPRFEAKKSVSSHEYSFISVNSIKASDTQLFLKKIELPYFNGLLISKHNHIIPNMQCTFVCVGRKANALIPVSNQQKGRTILVCTQDEYNELKFAINDYMDIMIVLSIESKTHGAFNKLQTITARRLAIFLAADYLQLKSFAMLDDNIQQIHTKQKASWEDIYEYLQKESQTRGCVSIPTRYGNAKTTDTLGSKCYLVNMDLIRQKRLQAERLFWLFPDAEQAQKWGEDYYFQLVLHYFLESDKINGFATLAEKNISLSRSKKNVNSHVNKIGKRAEPFDLIENAEPFVNKAIEHLNQIVEESYLQHQLIDSQRQQLDLLNIHAKAHQIAPKPQTNTITPITEDDFNTSFCKTINDYLSGSSNNSLRPYQIEALLNISKSQPHPGRIIMATGSGKSLIQFYLALCAFTAAKPGQHVFIVTPQIQLLTQAHQQFLKLIASLEKEKSDIYVSPEHIITVSSHDQSVKAKLLLNNTKIKSQKAIVICCEKSFKKIISEANLIQKSCLILLDEYHSYEETQKTLCEQYGKENSPRIIGLTATPPKNDHFEVTFFEYSLKDALKGSYHPPIVCQIFKKQSFSKKNVESIIPVLPNIIKHHNHPDYHGDAKLIDCKGLIYLNNIAQVESVKQLLLSKGIKAYAIHSDNPNAEKEIAQITSSDEPCVMLAVRMLRIGYDDPKLAWVMILREPSSTDPEQDITQMIGRLLRLEEKVGLILTFEDIASKFINPLLIHQDKSIEYSCEWLAQNNSYTEDVVYDSDEEEIFKEKKRTPAFFKEMPVTKIKTLESHYPEKKY